MNLAILVDWTVNHVLVFPTLIHLVLNCGRECPLCFFKRKLQGKSPAKCGKAAL